MKKNITLHFEHTKTKKALKQLSEISGFNFAYKDDDLASLKEITFNTINNSLFNILNEILSKNQLEFEQVGNNIIIHKIENHNNIFGTINSYSKLPQDSIIHLTGTVLNDTGEPIFGSTITIISKEGKEIKKSDQTYRPQITNKKGQFEFSLPNGKYSFKIEYIGYETQIITKDINKGKENNVTVSLKIKSSELNDVVVTGMMNFDHKTFSGATATYSGEALKAVTNTNVISALKTLDPSFLLIENNDAGSDPNVLPTINMRGTTSISSSSLQNEFSSDVNQPLFILDNFETDLRTVMDLDINRIASITLLKDAASTAIYGSRASNGVVVIETIKPTAGKIRLSYNSDWNVELADLSAYNMMNAAEKLEFERLSGVYVAPSSLPELQSTYYDQVYSQHLQDVISGVNSDWLNVPLQTAVTQRHGLYAQGGSESLLFNAGGSYKNQKGVMKGSGRDDWSGRINLTYQLKGLSINNNLMISGYNSTQSPYGSFSNWVNTNPYYKKLNADSIYLYTFYDWTSYTNIKVVNPLYNANLNSFNKSKQWGISDNLQISYNISSKFRFLGTFQISKNTTQKDQFVSPLNSNFLDSGYLRKGSYYSYESNNFSYTGSAMITYAQAFNKSLINANARIEISNNEYSSQSFNAIGFPSSSDGNLAQSYSFAENSKPYSAKNVSRRNSFINTLTYSYDQKYSADISFNYDGSTAFGKNNVYSPFYSFGVNWNLGNEDFIKSFKWISMLRLRANYGVTGNQGFSSYTSITTYSYTGSYNYNGIGVEVESLGNPNLKWQNTYQTSYGIDASLMDNRMTFSINGYNKLTSPLVVDVDVPISTGVSSVPFNAGKLNVKGIDGNISFFPIYNRAKNITWSIGVTGSYYVSKYRDFGSLLNSLNDSLLNSSSLTRFKDGYAPDDIWAVKSLGIDPATGQEIFLKKDGVTRTFTYNSSDIVKVGNSRPLIQGVINNSVLIKGFMLSLSFRYILHQDILNSALYNKVENISTYSIINHNQDKRALYERWKNPGDIAQFKAISLTSSTPISSRFIQRENTLSLESLSTGYDFSRTKWVRKSGIFSTLKITAYTNDIFRISTVKRERGISYPYSHIVSFSLTANLK